MPIPRRESASGPTSVSAYVLERKLLRAYDALYAQATAACWTPEQRRAVHVALLGGKLADTQVRGAEKRLREAMPELIQRLTPEQQPQVAALLLVEDPDLTAVVRELIRLERNLNYREDDPRLLLNDDAKLKAAGMGRLSRAVYGKPQPLGEPLVLTPWVPGKVAPLRTQKRRVVQRGKGPGRGQLAIWPPVGALLGGLVRRAAL